MNRFDFFHWTFVDELNNRFDPRIEVIEQRNGLVLGALYPQNIAMDLNELEEFFRENMIVEQDLYDWIEENIEWY